MISNFTILIPVYQFYVVPLVKQLVQMADALTEDYEIIVIDDASDDIFKQKNAVLNDIKQVEYIENKQNIGRSKIRNLLFSKAKYASCIILDCDVLIAKDTFLVNYLKNLTDQNVVVGGHIYLKKPPKDKQKYFHWYYGQKSEVIPFEQRIKNAYQSFMTNSFAINKALFNKIRFDENITEYGHEDTLFGIALAQHEIAILHINNPVVHIGLETETIFLQKQEKAIQNLAKLYQQEQYHKLLFENVKLLRFYEAFKESKWLNVIIYLIENFSKLPILSRIGALRLVNFNLWKFISLKKAMTK